MFSSFLSSHSWKLQFGVGWLHMLALWGLCWCWCVPRYNRLVSQKAETLQRLGLNSDHLSAAPPPSHTIRSSNHPYLLTWRHVSVFHNRWGQILAHTCCFISPYLCFCLLFQELLQLLLKFSFERVREFIFAGLFFRWSWKSGTHLKFSFLVAETQALEQSLTASQDAYKQKLEWVGLGW